MKKIVVLVLGLALTVSAAMFSSGSRAQTVQGDILRGEGRFLAGAGWYNLNTARADRINVETWKAINVECQRLYRDYMIDRYRHIQYKKNLTNKAQQEAERQFEEAQERWRTKPTTDDIISGDALNALAGDLADPSIDVSTWRTAQVDLPTGISLTTLAFKIADKKKAALAQSTVAVDRMLVKDGWPLAFRRPEIERECGSYEKSVTAVVDKCKKGTELQARDYDQLRAAVSTLADKVKDAIPTLDNQRTKSLAFVKRLDASTKIFAEQSYAEQLIRDVSEHKATTIAELLGFMRQYRLLFSDPGDSPEVESLYEQLYALLRQQLTKLGLDRPAGPTDRLRAGSVWNGAMTYNPDQPQTKKMAKAANKKTPGKKAAEKKVAEKNADGPQYQLIVQTRNGNRFSGESIWLTRFVRKVQGTIGDGQVHYQERDQQGHGYAFDGTINAGEMRVQFDGTNAAGTRRSGQGLLTLQ
jgi:hypothetical protein